MSPGFHAAEQVRRKDKGPVLGSGCLHLASTILFVLGAIFGWTVWRNAGDSGDPAMMRRLALGGFAVLSLPIAITIIQVLRLRRSLGVATLIIPQDWLPLGFRGNATYVRPLRHGAAVQELEPRLQCEEVVVKGSGKNKSEKREIVYDEPVAPIITPGLDELRVQLPLQIPASGPASLDLPEARIEWTVRLRLRMQGCPNTRSSFRLDVVPAIVER